MSLPDSLEYANRYDYGRALCEHFGTLCPFTGPKCRRGTHSAALLSESRRAYCRDLLRPGTLFRRVSVVSWAVESSHPCRPERIRMVQSVVKTQYCGCFDGGLWWEPAVTCAHREQHGPDDVFDGWTVTEIAPDCTDIVKAQPKADGTTISSPSAGASSSCTATTVSS